MEVCYAAKAESSSLPSSFPASIETWPGKARRPSARPSTFSDVITAKHRVSPLFSTKDCAYDTVNKALKLPTSQ